MPVVVSGHLRVCGCLGVAVRVEHVLAIAVDVEHFLDLLHATDPAAGDEVAQDLILRGLERVLTAVARGARLAARSAAARPLVAPVPVQVDADLVRAGVCLAVLAPAGESARTDVVHGAIRVEHRDDPDLARVDDRGHALAERRRLPVVVGQQMDQVQALLGGEVLAGVHVALDEDLRLSLVAIGVVADLDRPDRPALEAVADARQPGDPVRRTLPVRSRHALQVRGHLGVGVVARVAGGEVGNVCRAHGRNGRT